MAAARRIGLTGGIGSGKSRVASRLQVHGAHLVDTDAIARELTAAGGAAMAGLRERFGPSCLAADGSLDRAWMRELAFADPAQRAALEAVLHPLIGAEAERRAAQAASGSVLVFEVPLLVESGRWRERVDRVLVVDCPAETQVERVVQRAGWTRDMVLRVIDQQVPRELRRAAADAVIDNRSQPLDALHAQVDRLWERWSRHA